MPRWLSAIVVGLCIIFLMLVLLIGVCIIANLWPGYFTIGMICAVVLGFSSFIGHAALGDL